MQLWQIWGLCPSAVWKTTKWNLIPVTCHFLIKPNSMLGLIKPELCYFNVSILHIRNVIWQTLYLPTLSSVLIASLRLWILLCVIFESLCWGVGSPQCPSIRISHRSQQNQWRRYCRVFLLTTLHLLPLRTTNSQHVSLPPLLKEDPVFRQTHVHEGFGYCF